MKFVGLAADMFETMYEGPDIGLATQDDHHIQLIVMDISENQPFGVH